MTRRPDEEIQITAGSGDIVLDQQGALRALKLGEKRIDLPYPRTMFGIEGRDCTASVPSGPVQADLSMPRGFGYRSTSQGVVGFSCAFPCRGWAAGRRIFCRCMR
jgi:hypothetical protein